MLDDVRVESLALGLDTIAFNPATSLGTMAWAFSGLVLIPVAAPRACFHCG